MIFSLGFLFSLGGRVSSYHKNANFSRNTSSVYGMVFSLWDGPIQSMGTVVTVYRKYGVSMKQNILSMKLIRSGCETVPPSVYEKKKPTEHALKGVLRGPCVQTRRLRVKFFVATINQARSHNKPARSHKEQSRSHK